MKLQYRYTGIMIVFGVLIFVPIFMFISIHDYNLLLKKELQTLSSVAARSAEYMDSHIKENGYLAVIISGSPDLSNTLNKSNFEFEKMTAGERQQRIETGPESGRKSVKWKDNAVN